MTRTFDDHADRGHAEEPGTGQVEDLQHRLLPIYDSQVKAVLGNPRSIRECLWTWFQHDAQRTKPSPSCAMRSAASTT
ncbi:hypothetical protein [Amycolatopsis sp. cmx-4-68]|uniref:hypothetical protein n=1 Tax=Amycolatopsis sp. cmx-4-68 TaxID=2790938 RepID=UPI003978D9BB